MAYGDRFTEALSTARRRSKLSGHPLSPQETIAIAEGSARAMNAIDADLAKIEETKRANREMEAANARRQELAERRFQYEQQMEKQNRIIGGATSGAQIGNSIYPGWGGAIGGILGAGAGWYSGASDEEQKKTNWWAGTTALTLDPLLSIGGGLGWFM